LGVAAVIAAAAAGSYFFYGKNGAKNRKKLKSWALKMKADVMEGIENLKEVSEPAYNQVVDEVSRRYAKLKQVDPRELAQVAKEIKSHWRSLTREFAKKPKSKKAKK